MKAIDRLTDNQVLALARFIQGCARARRSTRWRSYFAESAQRKSFVPYVSLADQGELLSLIARYSSALVCSLRTSQVVAAANEVSVAYGLGPLEMPLPRPEGRDALV